jgi:phosphopantothenate synthetase
MDKTVIVIDLNPLSRSSQTGSITIVNEVTRCIAEMVDGFDSDLPSRSDYVHEETLQAALDSIVNGMKDRFKTVE